MVYWSGGTDIAVAFQLAILYNLIQSSCVFIEVFY